MFAVSLAMYGGPACITLTTVWWWTRKRVKAPPRRYSGVCINSMAWWTLGRKRSRKCGVKAADVRLARGEARKPASETNAENGKEEETALTVSTAIEEAKEETAANVSPESPR